MPIFAPREKQPMLGYWGRPTSTLDFCEENYIVNFYMAEFCKPQREIPLFYGLLCREHAYKCFDDYSSIGWGGCLQESRTGASLHRILYLAAFGRNWISLFPWVIVVSDAVIG